MSEHIVARRTYYLVFTALMLGTLLTVQMAYIDLGRFSPVVALGIAIVKATLVILFFMHVRYSTRLTWVVIASGFFWLGILLVLTLSDYLSRGWLAPWVSAGSVGQ